MVLLGGELPGGGLIFSDVEGRIGWARGEMEGVYYRC